MDYRIISALIGLASGFAGSLMTPLIKWDIEKRRMRRNARREKIDFWRKEIDQHDNFADCMRTRTFNDLRPMFTREQQQSWDAVWKGVYLGEARVDDRIKLLQFHTKVSEIEKRWRLI